MVEQHVEPPPIPLIKGKHDDKLDKDFLRLELRRDPTSEKSGLYEFKIALFLNGNQEKNLLFVRNSNITLKDSGTLDPAAKVQCFCTLVHREVLQKFYLLSAEVESTKYLTVEVIILGLGFYFFLLIFYRRKSAQCAAE